MTRRTPAVVLLALALASAACGGDSGADTPSASLTAPPTSERSTTTRALTPEEEVEAAYLRSWDVYAKAMLELDDSELDQAFAKDALELRRTEVAERRAEGIPARLDVEHGVVSVDIDGSIARLRDEYVNHSVLVDPETFSPVEDDPDELIRRVYLLERIGERWFVVLVRPG